MVITGPRPVQNPAYRPSAHLGNMQDKHIKLMSGFGDNDELPTIRFVHPRTSPH